MPSIKIKLFFVLSGLGRSKKVHILKMMKDHYDYIINTFFCKPAFLCIVNGDLEIKVFDVVFLRERQKRACFIE